ncbi:MAG: response regulator transcription factor [Candidatus Nanopelagicales bacterium]|jgi:DNA-binding NarL/FixJ family response regulator|nr:response regulator transcription factor [Candidatus Nanopelagicales bacterium]
MTGPAPQPIRVLLVDDHEVVRVGLRLLLGRFDDLQVVGEAADGAAAVAQVGALQPDVVLMDLSMPGMDGVTATSAIAAEHTAVHVVALTTFADREHVTAAIDAGAVGFLLKDVDPGALADAVRAAARGEAPLDPRAALSLIDRRRGTAAAGRDARPTPGSGPVASGGAGELTAREREVLALVGQGLSNRLIARRLGIAEKTVKAHLTHVFAVIGVTDRVQAALWWQRHEAG